MAARSTCSMSLLSPVGRFNIRLVVRDMPLAIGRYYFDFRLSNLPTRQVYDSFEQAVVFDVETFDPYQRGAATVVALVPSTSPTSL